MKKTLCIFLIFFLLFGIPIPAFAESTSDVIPPALDPSLYDSYLIYRDGSNYICILYFRSDWDLYAHDSYIDDEIFIGMRFYAKYSDSRKMYRASVPVSSYDNTTANNGWGTFTQLSGGNGYGYETDSEGNKRTLYAFSLTRKNSEIIASSQTIYYGHVNDTRDYVVYTDTVFFYQPLTLEGATAEALTQFQTQTSHNLMIIVLCGVGCLAFLISLPILRKVLLRFLNR